MKRTLSPHHIASLIVSILLALGTTAVQAAIPSSERTALVAVPAACLPPNACIPSSERTALAALYTNTNGASWTNSTNWNNPYAECAWYGITCDVGGTTVTGINLNFNNLTGTLPASLLNTLPNLVNFDVGSNQLTGSIPALTGLTNLVSFAVDINQLTGTIPALADLTNLRAFYVNNNRLTGTIPALADLTNLRAFYVNNNRLTGNVPSVPTSNALLAGNSGLCPNALNHTPDSAWDKATGVTPWYTNCQPLNLVPILELLLLD